MNLSRMTPGGRRDDRRLVIVATRALRAMVAALVAATPAVAKSKYDGTWSVLIITEKGTCDRGYRYPVRIVNGTVQYAGEASFDVSGRVAANGAVTVSVSKAGMVANGSGRLGDTAGSGSWQAGNCSGVWEAERRS